MDFTRNAGLLGRLEDFISSKVTAGQHSVVVASTRPGHSLDPSATVQVLPLDGSVEHLLGLLEVGTDRRTEGAPHSTDLEDPKETEEATRSLNALCKRLSEDSISRKVGAFPRGGPPGTGAAPSLEDPVCLRTHTQTCTHTHAHMHTCAHGHISTHTPCCLPILGPALWGWHFLSPLILGKDSRGARPGAKMTSLPALGPEIQVEGALSGNALGQARGLRDPFHSVWGSPTLQWSIYGRPPELAREGVLEPTRPQVGGMCALALAEPG